MKTNEELRSLMEQQPDLTRKKIAALTASRNVSTVDRWLASPKLGRRRNPTFRRMPESKLMLLKLSIQLNPKSRSLNH